MRNNINVDMLFNFQSFLNIRPEIERKFPKSK